jgi:hypothetical protein
VKTCAICNEPIANGQRYFDAPRVVHATCRKADELNTETIRVRAELEKVRTQATTWERYWQAAEARADAAEERAV